MDIIYGYFVGTAYYNGYSTNAVKKKVDSTDKLVTMRVDQIVDYVDNDLIIKYEDNLSSTDSITYVNYTLDEIGEKELLKGITKEKIANDEISEEDINDGKNAYITETKNNLIFSVEDSTVNDKLYKYMTSLKANDMEGLNEEEINTLISNNIYEFEFQGSRTLTSEVDSNGLEITNFAEIVKVTNSVGRKLNVSASNNTDKVSTIGDSSASISKIGGDIISASSELDTDFTEYITFSPPTGLSQSEIIINNGTHIAIIILPVCAIIIGIAIIVIQFNKRKKFYK
jgi:hypothetical protein